MKGKRRRERVEEKGSKLARSVMYTHIHVERGRILTMNH